MPSRTVQDAIALLKADHRKVEGLFAKFEKAKDSRTKQALAQEICTELTVHTIIEEEIFYPACEGAVEEDLHDEAYVEHDGAKVLVAELAQGGPDDEFYDAKMTVLSEQIKHHVKEEEKPGDGYFAQAPQGRARHGRAGRTARGAQTGTAGADQAERPAAAGNAQLHRPQDGAGHPGRVGGIAMRSGCLWLLGVPIPIIILLWLITGHA
ncbi:MAG: hemerythrin domain-containing protein [Rhizomicrobium sp.]